MFPDVLASVFRRTRLPRPYGGRRLLEEIEAEEAGAVILDRATGPPEADPIGRATAGTSS